MESKEGRAIKMPRKIVNIELIFFFFKQKTAYEVCGRDWSSDVCSSDLPLPPAGAPTISITITDSGS